MVYHQGKEWGMSQCLMRQNNRLRHVLWKDDDGWGKKIMSFE